MLINKKIEPASSHLEIRKVAKSEWKTPLPLQKQLTEEAPYPIDALPRILQQAITGYQREAQRHSPFRGGRDFSDAISLLIEHHYIKQRKSGKKIFLAINPILHG